MTLPDYFDDPSFAGHLKVLEVLRRWDPIGVICESNQDEYDSYSTDFLTMLDRGATTDDIVRTMQDLVTGHMGMSSFDEVHSRSCAEELVEFWRSWKGGES